MPPAAGGDHPPRTPWMAGGRGDGTTVGLKKMVKNVFGGYQSRERPRPPWMAGVSGGDVRQAMRHTPPSSKSRGETRVSMDEAATTRFRPRFLAT